MYTFISNLVCLSAVNVLAHACTQSAIILGNGQGCGGEVGIVMPIDMGEGETG